MRKHPALPEARTVGADGSLTVSLPPLSFRADVQPATIDEENRTVELIFTTGAPVQRFDWASEKSYLETLSLDPAHIRLDRLNGGAPLLDSHSAWSVADILGATIPGSASLTKKDGRVLVRFSKRDSVAPIWQDVRDGIIRSVSVGYRVYKFEETAPSKANALPVRRAVDWEPFEVSMVPIPADAGAMARGAKPADTNPCQIVMRAAAPADVPGEPPKKEKLMDSDRSEYIAEQPEPAPAAPAPAVQTEPSERDLGVKVERARVEGILQAVRAARLPKEFADRLVREGKPLEACQAEVFAEMAKRDMPEAGPGPVPAGARIEVGDDPIVHKRRGIEAALCHRVAPELFRPCGHQIKAACSCSDASVAREYLGLSLMDTAEIFLRARGLRLTGLTKTDRASLALESRGGMHTTSDFPLLLADVSRKVLRAAYEEAPQTWLQLARPVSLSDFKASKQLQIGDAPDLLEVLEHGEYKSGTITEAKEQIQLATYGRIFAITRVALINDDTGSFGQVPAAFGRAARRLENTKAWAQITSNPTMGDGNSLFDSTNHGNYTSSGTAISVDALGVGRKLLRQQKGIDGTTPLNLMARYLIVPAAKETIADQYVTQITPAQGSNVNPFSANGRTPLTVIVEPLLDANSQLSWYMATDPASCPVLLYGTLEGQIGPRLAQEVGFDVDGLRFKCSHDVAFKAADWRGIYKNAGA